MVSSNSHLLIVNLLPLELLPQLIDLRHFCLKWISLVPLPHSFEQADCPTCSASSRIPQFEHHASFVPSQPLKNPASDQYESVLCFLRSTRLHLSRPVGPVGIQVSERDAFEPVGFRSHVEHNQPPATNEPRFAESVTKRNRNAFRQTAVKVIRLISSFSTYTSQVPNR